VAEAATTVKRAAVVLARKETTNQPSQPRVFIDLGDDDPPASGGAGHQRPRSRPLVAADLSSSGAISAEEVSNSILATALANSGT
jgi:hypothetical protein